MTPADLVRKETTVTRHRSFIIAAFVLGFIAGGFVVHQVWSREVERIPSLLGIR